MIITESMAKERIYFYSGHAFSRFGGSADTTFDAVKTKINFTKFVDFRK
jgi:hypothetical protein